MKPDTNHKDSNRADTNPEGSNRAGLQRQRLSWAAVAGIAVLCLAVLLWPSARRDFNPSAPRRATGELARLQKTGVDCPGSDRPPAGPFAGLATVCLGSGRRLSFAQVFDGRPAVVNVFAAWCQPCRGELPVMAEVAREQRVPVVLVHRDDDSLAGLTLLQGLHVRVPAVSDSEGRIAGALGLGSVIPQTVLVDARGVVVARFVEVFHSASQLEDRLRPYLARLY